MLYYLQGLKEEQYRLSATDAILCRQLRFRHVDQDHKPVVWKGIDHDGILERIGTCYNGSFMIYVLDIKGQAHDFREGMLRFLDIWLYLLSFAPYQSQTESRGHITQTSTITWEKGCSKPTIEEIDRWHKGLCGDLSDGKVMSDLPPELLDFQLEGYLGHQHGPLLTKENILDAFSQTHILKPTFQSLFIVLDQETRPDEGPFKANDSGNIPVYLVNTKCTHHARHANSICNIPTTFKVAIQFVVGRSAVMVKYPRALWI